MRTWMMRMWVAGIVCLLAACGGDESGNSCEDVVCDQPPPNECKDDQTVLSFDPAGTCNPDNGRCEYPSREKPCLEGCAAGRCTEEQVCIDDGHELGPPCQDFIRTEEDFEVVAVIGGRNAATKYMLPASGGAELQAVVFQNSKRFRLHVCFLCCALPGFFGSCNCDGLPEICTDPERVTPSEYLRMIMKRGERTYFAGVVQRVDDVVEGRVYGFNVWTELSDPAEQLEMSEVRAIYERLHEVFLPDTLAYMPTDPPAVAKARSWLEPDFPVYLGFDAVTTEVYTAGTSYGRVRRMTLEELEAAIGRGELGWQDIVVVDRVPFDIETVVAAVITGGRQWELSHVNVRMARRGTPNLYVKEALQVLEEHEGQLVRLQATKAATAGSDDRYTIQAAELQEAEAWWAEHRPDIGTVPGIERNHRTFETVLEMDTGDPVPLISRVGGKAANLARLYTVLPDRYQVPAFAIPFAWFEDCMEANVISDTRVEPPEEVSLRVYVDRLIGDERFRTDAAYRRDRLWDLRAAILNDAVLDPDLVTALAARIEEVFGSPSTRVRFRSSSNVEDALEFSGAGLYTSTTVCAADSLDDDLDGPSVCDLEQDEERTIERGLRKVWASLYNNRAWEERAWYQVPQEQSSMAILVSLAFPGERSNGVAFTGNPQKSTDSRYLINAQLGDESVVGNDPRVVPERDLVEVDAETGMVTKIYRSRSSALAEPGTYVLTDEQLEELGALMFQIVSDYPQDTGPYAPDKVLQDMEFKVDAEGQFRIKQIRPFLDKCRNLTCLTPPDDVCKDVDTLLEYRTYGSCDAGTGECRYDVTEKPCDNGCADGSCQ